MDRQLRLDLVVKKPTDVATKNHLRLVQKQSLFLQQPKRSGGTLQKLGSSLPLAFLIILMSCLLCFGQSTSVTIHGTVVDDSGALVSGASVTLRFKGETIKIITSSDWGKFTFVNLEPGDYVIEIEVKGFSLFRYHVTIPRPLDKSLEHNIYLTIPFGGEPLKGAGRNPNPGPPKKQHLTFTDPSWNVWIEPYSSSPSYKPLMSMEPAHTYSLALDIAALAYEQ